jgi:hypothetical protein
MNAFKDFYLKAIDWIVAHPHQMLGYSAAAVFVAIVLL